MSNDLFPITILINLNQIAGNNSDAVSASILALYYSNLAFDLYQISLKRYLVGSLSDIFWKRRGKIVNVYGDNFFGCFKNAVFTSPKKCLILLKN
jgi:hypothetical protein